MRKQKHTVLKRIFAFTLAAALAVGSNFSVPGTAATVEAATTYTGTNIESQNRATTQGYGMTTKSYITKTSNDQIMVVQAIGNGATNDVSKIVIEYYDSNFNLQNTKEIPMPTGYSFFGGFHESESKYYIVVGRDNSLVASNNISCWEIIQYDKTWDTSTTKTVNLTGTNNTLMAFEQGGLSFAEYGKYLVIRSCHYMLTRTSGNTANDQGSATIILDTSNMTIVDSQMVKSASTEINGCVMNSYAQFVRFDDNHIVSAELTNKGTPGIVLVKYRSDITTGKLNSTSGNACEIIQAFSVPVMPDGSFNVSLGGFEVTDNNYLFAGNSSMKVMEGGTSTGGKDTTRNIFISVVNKTTGKAETKWLTEYEKYSISASTPHMVKLANNSYLVLWSRVDSSTKKNTVYYQKIDGDGNTVDSLHSVEGNLSDCVPTIINNKLVWYTWKNNTKVFYEIDLSTFKATTTSTGAIEVEKVLMTDGSIELAPGKTYQLNPTVLPENATNKTLKWETSNSAAATVKDGLITAVGAGTAEISATTTDGSNIKVLCLVTVKDATVLITSLIMDPTTLILNQGEAKQIKTTIEPTNATVQTLEWKSNDTGIATVNPYGYVTAVAPGKTKILASTTDGSGKTVSCEVTVTSTVIPVDSVKLVKNSLSLTYGNTETLEATVWPSNATNKAVTWQSSDINVASVENGKVTAVGPGITDITVTTVDGCKTDVCAVKVFKQYETPADPVAETIADESITLVEQEGCQYSKDNLNWQESNEFTGLTPATEYTFYVKKLASGYYTESDVSSAKIRTADRLAKTLTLDKTEVTVEDGTQNVIQLTATLTPNDVTNKTIKWSSNDETVAAVDQTGKVTAKQEGTATITAATTDGTNLTATCTITVNAKIISVESVTLDKKEISLTMGEKESDTLNATVNPEAATNKTVLWKTSDSSIATVTNGKVTAVGAGSATITAYADENADIKAECTVKVYQKYEAPSAPTKKSVTDTSITLESMDGCVYSKDGTTWQSSNEFTGLTADTDYTFYAKKSKSGYYLESDKSAGTTIRTAKTPVAVTGVTLNETTKHIVLENGGGIAFSLTATVTPADATNKNLKWSSSNTAIATVSNHGTVMVRETGTVVITVETEDGGYKATCTLTIERKIPTPDPTPSEPKPSDPGQTGPSISEPTPPTPAYVPNIDVTYKTHVQSFGWQDWKKNGQMAGTSGLAKRLESININVASAESGHKVDLGVQYTTHVQSYGWMPWSANGDASGTEGEAKRLEAIKIQLTGADKDKYDIYYRVHAQSYGWLGWAKNGAPAGTAGYAKRLEGIQIVVVKKGESFNQKMEGISSAYQQPYVALAGTSPVVGGILTSSLDPQIGGTDTPNVTYRTHVQSIGWQGWKFNGQMSGTSGQAKRLEGIEIKLTNQPYPGDILYTTHVQSYGWQGDVKNPLTWRRNGTMAGTSGQAKRLEAICITLTGEMAEHYDIYYRVHAQSFGWLGWAKNGDPAGTAGYAKRLEGINIVLVPKGGSAPGSTVRSYVEK